VLTEQRRRPVDACRGVGHANGRSQLALDASLRVLDVNHELHGLGLRVVEKLRERVDRREQDLSRRNRSSIPPSSDR